MTFLFLSLSIVIAIIVIAVSAKHIKAGMEARSNIKDVKETSLSSTDEDTLAYSDLLKNSRLHGKEVRTRKHTK